MESLSEKISFFKKEFIQKRIIEKQQKIF